MSRVASPRGFRHDAAVAQARPSGASPGGRRARPQPGTGTPDPTAHAREEVLTRLYAEHAPSLMTFVLRLTGGDRQRAEDVVQETLLRAWRHADRLPRPGG